MSPRGTPKPANVEETVPQTAPSNDPQVLRHAALLPFLARAFDEQRDLLRELAGGTTLRTLVRAIALAGYNANPRLCERDPGTKALWAAEDAEAILAAGSDDEAGG